MADSQREDGYQMTNDHLSTAISTDKKCKVEEVVIESISKAEGSNKGENFTCVLFAVEIKAKVKGHSETFHYMVKCLPSNEFRAKMLTDMKGFERECFVYDHLVKNYSALRAAKGLKELTLPKVYLTNLEDGIIVMENLKTQGYTMLNRLKGEEMTRDMARQVLEETASFHATGYHYMQNFHKNGQKGFLKEHPDFDFEGWVNGDNPEGKAQFAGMLTGMLGNVTNLVETFGDDATKPLAKRMEKFLPNMIRLLDDKTTARKEGFHTLTHNDLHMNNVMYKKLDNGEIDDVLLLDLQLMKFTRVTVDLAYFFGSSSFYKFRAEHLDGLLKVYHKKLIQELAIFGYPKSVYTFEKFLSDYEDTWVFGFVMGCMHIQILNMNFEGPDAFDPEKIKDEFSQMEMMEKMKAAQLERAKDNKPYLEKVFGLVKEAANKNII